MRGYYTPTPFTYGGYTYGSDYSTATGAGSTLLGGLCSVGFMVIWLGFFLVFYLVGSFSMFKVAKRLGSDKAWWAFVPVLNIMLMLDLADMPLWYVLAYIVPCIGSILGLIVLIMSWVKILEKLNKPSWHVVLVIFFNIFYTVYLAFFDKSEPQIKKPTA